MSSRYQHFATFRISSSLTSVQTRSSYTVKTWRDSATKL